MDRQPAPVAEAPHTPAEGQPRRTASTGAEPENRVNLVTHPQGSPEWHDWRRGKATASRADVIMGCAPSWKSVRTWDELRLDMAGLGPEPDKWARRAFAHGHRMEPIARKAAVPGYAPACIEMDGDPRFTASLDGLLETLDGAVHWAEIKCPVTRERSTAFKAARDGRIPDHIRWQLVHQAGVIGDEATRCRYIVYVGPGDGEIADIDIPTAELLEDWPELHARWLEFLGDDSSGRKAASQAWLAAKRELDIAKARLAEARIALTALGPGEAAGVKVAQIERKGSVDWKAAAASYGCDETGAEPFRRPSTTTTTIREIKT